MKKLLPLLLCYILLACQTSAFARPPSFGNGRINTLGSYSGVIRGLTETSIAASGNPGIPGDTLPGVSLNPVLASNALGLFDLVVPGTGTATGAFLLFSDGRVFSGVIDASVDPSTDQLSGVLNGAFNFSISTIVVTGTSSSVQTQQVGATAVGGISAKISGSNNANSATLARLAGTAFININFGTLNADLTPVIDRNLTFTVSGFKQTNSTTASAVSVLTTNPSGQNGAGGSGG